MKIIAYKEDVGQTYVDPFKQSGVYPFSKIGRVVVDKDSGAIKYRLNEYNSNFDDKGNPITLQDNEDVMVYFPAFYAKREWIGTVCKDTILTEVPTSATKGDYEVHSAFLREDGTVRPYILVGAFQGTEVNGQLRSRPSGANPKVSITLEAFRNLARSGRDSKWSVLTMDIISMIQLLYKVAFQDLNSQSAIGNGWTSKSASATIGSTMSLGNRSGYLGVNGNQISLFGVEDFYGNVWEFVDGFVVKDDGYYTTNNPNNFGITSTYTKINGCGKHLAGTSASAYVEGYVTKIEKPTGREKFFNLPCVLGGTETTYYCDYLWSHRLGQENICLFGALWDLGSRSGAFCLNWNSVASNAGATVGARICFLS